MIQPVSENKLVHRRNLPEYESNPSLPVACKNAKIGTRRITNRAGNKCMIVSAETGEIVAPAGFHEIVEVDKTQFIKLYVGGVSAFNDLSTAGSKVFKLVYNLILKSPNTDNIILSPKNLKSMAKATFERGLTELLNKEILYRSTVAYVFYLNVNYIYNGDRLALIKEYRLKEAAKSESLDSPHPDVKGESNISKKKPPKVSPEFKKSLEVIQKNAKWRIANE